MVAPTGRASFVEQTRSGQLRLASNTAQKREASFAKMQRQCIYELTPKGQRQLNAGRVEWRQFVRVLGGILGAPA